MQRKRVQYALALAVALLLHVAVFLVVPQIPTGSKRKDKEVIKVHYISPDAVKKPDNKNIFKKEPDRLPPGQVVATQKPQKERRPDKAKFLAEHNETVDREMQSAQKSPFGETVTKRPQTGKKNTDQESMPPAQAQRQALLKQSPNGIVPTPKKSDTPNLLPSLAQLSEQAAGMPFNDHIEKVQTGAETRLNTWEWRHATFFNRIKESVARVWSPEAQIRRYDPQGALLGQSDRVTVVSVTIDKVGNLVKVAVEKASGVDYLDEEAAAAFRRAAPFPNPPDALFGELKTFSFSFGFHLSLQKGWGLGFF